MKTANWKKTLAFSSSVLCLWMGGATYYKHQGIIAMADAFDKVAGSSAQVERVIATPTPKVFELSEKESNIKIIKKIWGNDWEIGVAIATCESGLRSDAFNSHNNDRTWDAGLFQINMIHGWEKDELMDPIANTGIAYAKFVEQGTSPWNNSKKCWEDK